MGLAEANMRIHMNFVTNLVVDDFDYAFAENGLTAYKLGKQLESQSFIKWIGEEKYKPLVNFILHYIADMDVPIKRYVHNTTVPPDLHKQFFLEEHLWNSVME